MSDQESLFITILNAKGIYKFNEKQIIRKNAKKYFLYIPFTFLTNELKVEIPLSQREKIEERVEYFNNFIDEEYKKTKEVPDLNILSITFFQNKFFIIDGQHRYHALKTFYEKNKRAMKDYYLLCTFYLTESKKEFRQIMAQINNNFISEEYLFITEDDEETVEEKRTAVGDYMKKHYSIYLSNKINCKPPLINIGTFLTYIFDLYPNISSFRMIRKIEEINKQLEEEYKKSDPEFYNRIQEFIVDKENIKLLFMGKICYEESKIKAVSTKSGRTKFPAFIRRMLWEKFYISELYPGECMVCNKKKLKMSTYEISHIVSLKNGGSNDISNLTVLCSQCNKSLNSNNLYENPHISKEKIEEKMERILKMRDQLEEERKKMEEEFEKKMKENEIGKNILVDEEKEEKVEKKKPVKKVVKKEESNVLVL